MTVIATLILGLLAITAFLNSGPPLGQLVQAVPVSVSVNLGPKDGLVASGPKPNEAESISVNIQLGDKEQKEQQKEDDETEDTPTTATTTTTPEPVTTKRAHKHQWNLDLSPDTMPTSQEIMDEIRYKNVPSRKHPKNEEKVTRDDSSEEVDEEEKERDLADRKSSREPQFHHSGIVEFGRSSHPWNQERIVSKRSVVEHPTEQNSTNLDQDNQNSTTQNPVNQNLTTSTPTPPSPPQSIPTEAKSGFWTRLIKFSRRILSALFHKIQSLFGWRPTFLDRFLGEQKPESVKVEVNGTNEVELMNNGTQIVGSLAPNSTAQSLFSANGTSSSLPGILPQDSDFLNEIEDYGFGRMILTWPSGKSSLRPPAKNTTTNNTFTSPPPLVDDKLDNHL